MLYGVQTPRRRDAQRNRSAILKAATEMMLGRHSTVLMPEIARRAGVGQATLYRHFPDRQALTAAVIAHELARLEALVAANADRPAAFRDLLAELLRTQIAMRPLVLHVRRLDRQTRDRYQQRMITTLAAPLRLAQQAGHVRADLAPSDLALLCTMVEGVVETADADAAIRSIDLMLEGVCRPAAPATAAAAPDGSGARRSP
ncbi:helix-turn-helix domain-containing protein [Dactylosporangium sp. NPDC005555]|uniref:TetR/AcrR family transcriptional regulator n=1 Tax=Dactylosporangium sp. NPDC005555 TaxID=3154889 RepID=UPI00339ECFC5